MWRARLAHLALCGLTLHGVSLMIGTKGTAPTDPRVHGLAVLAHCVADLGGWTRRAIAALATLTLKGLLLDQAP